MRWDQGRSTIEEMLRSNRPALQQVTASRPHADRLIAQARAHLDSATRLGDVDPEGAYALMYDAARKALTAVLENQGLRPTSAGGHVAVYNAVRAQLDPPMGRTLRPFDRMRRNRRNAEYPPTDVDAVTAEQVAEDLPKATAIVDLADKVLGRMSAF